MAKELEIPRKLYRRLQEAAEQRGLTIDQYLSEMLRKEGF